MIIILIALNGTVFLLSLVGNVSVLCVIIKDRRFHSATYILVANLAAADVLMSVACHPLTLVTNLLNGKIKCQISNLLKDFGLRILVL
ncbi:unnamed protein product [Lymnaea stagnalis]|uniref:G-protein coupled receptors family 1 profile domain-containing protein n=1 Tax=Lymnaea stagnalis TaxID=6523 RepID=A0AAV2HB02_LYMST